MKIGISMDGLLLIICMLAGGLGGAGITAGFMKTKDPKIIEKTIEVDRSLSNADLLKIPCSENYIKEKGQLLCREMFCRMNTRSGNQSNVASAKECEAISNIINKSHIIKYCSSYAQQDDKKERSCLEFFDRRL